MVTQILSEEYYDLQTIVSQKDIVEAGAKATGKAKDYIQAETITPREFRDANKIQS